VEENASTSDSATEMKVRLHTSRRNDLYLAIGVAGLANPFNEGNVPSDWKDNDVFRIILLLYPQIVALPQVSQRFLLLNIPIVPKKASWRQSSFG
jgi:hypothetical protein